MYSVFFDVMYLTVAGASIYSIYVDPTWMIPCAYMVGGVCVVDFVGHATGVRPMRTDMILHHQCALGIVGSLHLHLDLMNIYRDLRDELMTGVLSTEVSTLFLILHTWLSKRQSKRQSDDQQWLLYVAGLNRACFVGTFVYYRIYHYYVAIVANRDLHLFMDNVIAVASRSRVLLRHETAASVASFTMLAQRKDVATTLASLNHPPETPDTMMTSEWLRSFVAYASIHGLFYINLYWLGLLAKKMLRG